MNATSAARAYLDEAMDTEDAEMRDHMVQRAQAEALVVIADEVTAAADYLSQIKDMLEDQERARSK